MHLRVFLRQRYIVRARYNLSCLGGEITII